MVIPRYLIQPPLGTKKPHQRHPGSPQPMQPQPNGCGCIGRGAWEAGPDPPKGTPGGTPEPTRDPPGPQWESHVDQQATCDSHPSPEHKRAPHGHAKGQAQGAPRRPAGPTEDQDSPKGRPTARPGPRNRQPAAPPPKRKLLDYVLTSYVCPAGRPSIPSSPQLDCCSPPSKPPRPYSQCILLIVCPTAASLCGGWVHCTPQDGSRVFPVKGR